MILIDCGEAVQIAYYKALLDVLDSETFDYLFAADGPLPFFLGMTHPQNPLIKITRKLQQSDPFTEGCWVYKGNTPLYSAKHINGDCLGFNLLYSEKRYFGFGLDPKGETEAQLGQSLLAEYNRQPMGMKGITDKLSQAIASTFTTTSLESFEKLKAHTITLQEFYQTGGGKTYGANVLNINVVKACLFDKVSAREAFKKT